MLFFSVAAPTGAQTIASVSFDPTPVRIPSLEKTELRPATSLDLLTIRDLKGVAISPNGKYVAFVVGQAVYETNGYRSGMFVVGTGAGSRPVNLGTAGLPYWDGINQWSVEPPQWSPDSESITYRTRMSATASWQVWCWDIKGGQPRQLSNVRGDVRSYQWTPDGSKIVIKFGKPEDSAEARRFYDDGILYDGSFNAGRGRPVVSEFLENEPRAVETWIHVVATGEERKETQEEAESVGPWVSDIGEEFFNGLTLTGHHIIDAKVSPDGKRVAYRYVDDTPHSKVLYRLFSKPIRGGTPIEIAPATYIVGDYWWSANSSDIYYVHYAGDGRAGKLMMVPADGGRGEQILYTLDRLYFYSADGSGRLVACASEDAHSPAAVALVDLAGRSVRTLVDLNPEFKNIRLGSTERLDGLNRYGDAWYAHLVKPLNYEAGKRYPVIVVTYRSHDGFLRGGSGDENPIHVYAAHGFAVLSFDMGFSPENRPGEFKDYISWYASEAASIEMALQEASRMGIVDPGRAGLTGYSRGAEIAGYLVTHTRLFAAVSGAAGDSTPYFYYMAGKSVQEHFSKEGLGGWPEGPSKFNWKECAPDLNADRIEAPILNNDPDSEFIGDLALYTSLETLGKPMELFIYPDELHHINQPKHRFKIYERNLDWFRFWLKNEEDGDPVKKQQYERWRRLRDLQQKRNTS